MKIFLKTLFIISAVAFLLNVSGCATPTTRPVEVNEVLAEIEAKKQREIALETLLNDEYRINDVAYNIYKHSVPLCGEKTRESFGIMFATKYMFSGDMREAALSLYNISNIVRIIHVIRGSAAEQAGIMDGDIPLAINDWPVPISEDAVPRIREKLNEAVEKGSKISLRVMRDDIEHTFELKQDTLCDYEILLTNEDIINAFADGKRVLIARGMLRFAENDNELALVISHELAHNVMTHIDAKMQNYMLGSILDIVAAVYGVDTGGTFGGLAAQAYSKEFEAEADYVGLYMMALAGLEIDSAPKFWRRMAVAHPGSINTNHSATHPATPYRFVALATTVREIKKKIEEGIPLKPELKKGRAVDNRTTKAD